MIYNAANMLTLSRLFMAVIFFVLIAFKSWWAVPVLVVAGITDLLDGYVARKYHMQTDFGRIADPAIDKVLICCGFILMVELSEGIIRAWMAAIIVGRELVVTALRSLVEGRGKAFAATFWGKSKMAVQFVALIYVMFLVLYWQPKISKAPDELTTIGVVLAWIATVTTFMSGMVYIIQAKRLIGEKPDA